MHKQKGFLCRPPDNSLAIERKYGFFSHLALTEPRKFLSYYRWSFLLLDLDILRYDYRVPLYNYILADNLSRSLGSDKETYSRVQRILVHILIKIRMIWQKKKEKTNKQTKPTQNIVIYLQKSSEFLSPKDNPIIGLSW